MNAEDLMLLIEGGETMTVEFKGEKKEDLNDSDLVLAVVCLANAKGGHLLIGVEDDQKITGARSRHSGGTDLDKLRSMIRNRTMPNIETEVSEVDFGGNKVLVVKVPEKSPCSTINGTSVKRNIGPDGKPACPPFYSHQQPHSAALGVDDLSAQQCDGSTWEDLDPLQFERVRKTIAAKSGDQLLLSLSDQEMAKAIGAVVTTSSGLTPTFAGILIFGREQAIAKHIPTHEAMFQVLRAGGDVRVNDNFRLGLVELSELMEERFKSRVEEKEVQVGMIRLPIPDFAFTAFREALLNALFHRDYRVNNSVYVQWHPNRLEISSPGSFPDGVNVENLLNHEPKPRNRRLYDIAKRIGLVENTGRGVDKVYLGQLRYGRPLPDYSASNATGVRLTLRGGEESLSLAAYVFELERRRGPISVHEMIAINKIFHERRITSLALAPDIQKTPSEAKAILEGLVEEGLLQGKGEHKGRVYHFSAAVYSALGKPKAHRRIHGLDPTEQELAVLNLLKTRTSIARQDVMEACGLSGREATRLLGNMVGRLALIPMGIKRGTRYKLPDNQP